MSVFSSLIWNTQGAWLTLYNESLKSTRNTEKTMENALENEFDEKGDLTAEIWLSRLNCKDPIVLWQILTKSKSNSFYIIQDWFLKCIHGLHLEQFFFTFLVVLGQASPTYLNASMPRHHQKY